MATLATRVISGRGLLRIPASGNLRKAKRLSLYVDVIRLPYNQYISRAYNPPKSRYATITIFKSDFLEQELCVEYPRQVFHFYPDPSAQVFYLAKCIYANIAEGLELGFAGAGSPIAMPDTFADWYHTAYWWDEAKVVCYADAAVRLVLKSEEFLLCDDDSDPDPPPPPSPPDEPPDVPPGTSLGDENLPLSPPYQSPDDNGDTVPFADDDVGEPPNPGCWRVEVSYTGVPIPPGTEYVIGLEDDVLAFRISGSNWELYDTVSGRTMYPNWVNTTSTPNITAATWQPECDISNPGGTPPT